MYSIVIFDEQMKVIDTIEFDSVSKWSESMSNSVPQSPVEYGSKVSDTIILNNVKFSLTGVITDSFFNDPRHEVTYLNGKFVKLYSDIQTNVSGHGDDRLFYVKKQINRLRENRQVFGILEHADVDVKSSGGRVRLYYPCALTEVSFDDSDGGNAIYPSMSIELIRVSTVRFKEVKNPPKNLIPHVRHGTLGNQTGASSSTEIKTDSDANDIIAQAKEAGKAAKPDMPEDSDLKKTVDGLNTKTAFNNAYAACEREYRAKVDAGQATFSGGAIWVTACAKAKVGGWNVIIPKL